MTDVPAPAFVPGAVLARDLFREHLEPALAAGFPGLPYAAAHIGRGSDVLGFDSERSTDHGWGPRVRILLPDESVSHIEAVRSALQAALPATVHGWPVARTGAAEADADLIGTTPGVHVGSLRGFLLGTLRFDALAGIGLADWLATPSQSFASVTSGSVFVDTHGALTDVLRTLAWYPDDVWRYLLANQWRRIGQELPFVGRAGEAGDELGSRVIAARLVNDAMRLGHLLERRHAPYAKWLASSFGRLDIGLETAPLLAAALTANGWDERQQGLAEAFALLGERQNQLHIAPAVDPTPRPFHDRPYAVVDTDGFAEAPRSAISDAGVLALPAWLGGIDQITDGTDAREPHLRARMRSVYSQGAGG